MSYDSRTYQRTTTTRGRWPMYAPPTRGNQRQHSTLGYWVPLIVTGTIAVGALGAWIWSERQHDDDDHYPQDKPPRPPPGMGPPPMGGPPPGPNTYPGPPGGPGSQRPPSGPPYPIPGSGLQGGAPPPGGPPGGEAASYYGTAQSSQSRSTQQEEDSTWYGRVGGIMRRAPSPQQVLDQASKQVSAGMAAAGSALGSIWEGEEESSQRYDERSSSRRTERRSSGRAEERDGFSDHERWSEEAEERTKITTIDTESERRAEAAKSTRDVQGKGKAKRAVAIVVSADTAVDMDTTESGDFRSEHASILSHIPVRQSSDNTDLFVLIYAPNLKSLPGPDYKPTSTLGSAYSQVSTPAATPGSELQSISPRIHAADEPNRQFDRLWLEAQPLVANSTQILPFTTKDGYVYILRQLAPQLVYVSDTLSGPNGDFMAQLRGWVGQAILVAGDEGHGGLADTETEDEGAEGKDRWYEHSSLIGLGKIEVVDAARVGDDWSRRVGGKE